MKTSQFGRGLHRLFAIGVIVASLFATAAWATLGRDAISVKDDGAHMRAALRVSRNDTSYSVHELTTPTGTVVREYVSPTGKVFGVAWRGPYLPDFRQILGDYFAPVMQAPRNQRQGRGPLEVRQPNVVFQSGGHMRAFFGRAYVPDMLPKGVTADVIQ
ncbi:MAG TPA: DUF2844 domain-containing protein [Terriglobales bacterium]|nr:DUF2844 domain-containing protein [Terriglobales bacterium]